jgi:hypothetical protein
MGSRSPAGPRRLRTATRMSASLSRRLSAFFGSTPDQGPKAAKFAVLSPGRAGFPNHAKRSEGSDTTPSETPRVSPCDPLCAILLAKVSVYPLSPVKTNVSRLCECDLKPLWRGFSLAIWDAPSAYLRQVGRLVEENRSPAEAQRSGFGGKRRRSGMSEFSPFSAETSGMELAVTNSRIKGWRRNRRSAQSLLPAVRAVDGGFNAVGYGAF